MKEVLIEKLEQVREFGIDLLELPYPLHLEPYGTVNSPEELALLILRLREEELTNLISTLQSVQVLENDEEVEEEELLHLYRAFKKEVFKLVQALPKGVKETILKKGKPKLKAYPSKDGVVVYLLFSGEEIPYRLFKGMDKDLIRRKAKLLVDDITAIARGDFWEF